jgi:hypothetical protein
MRTVTTVPAGISAPVERVRELLADADEDAEEDLLLLREEDVVELALNARRSTSEI